MVIINVVNLVSSILVFKQSRTMSMKDDKDAKYRRWMLAMGFIFTFVGLWRSIFVTSYGARRAWFGTILNSAGVVRTLAMFAELSFAGLIAYAMLKFNKYVPAPEDAHTSGFKKFILTKSPYILPICIFIANFCVNTKLFVGLSLLGTIEETLWSIGFLSILPLAIIQLRRILKVKDKKAAARLRKLKISAIVILIWCVVYCTYGLSYHLPTMWSYEIGIITSTGYPPLTTGISAILDPFTNINVLRGYGDWGFGFMLWHSAYFSICVWISVFLMQAPRPIDNPEETNVGLTRNIIISIGVAIGVLLAFIILPLFL
ncbi:MAG: hypothetical protein ACTSRE_13100 [Promethearchaeota archaeon]